MSKNSAKKQNLGRILRLTQLSVLVALLIIFGFTNIGYIKIGVIEITLNIIPVAIGAIVLGPSAGAICGAVFGLTSFWQAASGTSAFGFMLFQHSPVNTFIICFLPRLLEGLLTALIFKAMMKACKNNNSVPCAVASLCCPLLNTLLFVGSFILFFMKTEIFSGLYTQSAANSIAAFFIWFVGLNGLVEAIAGFIIATAVSKALLVANKRLKL